MIARGRRAIGRGGRVERRVPLLQARPSIEQTMSSNELGFVLLQPGLETRETGRELPTEATAWELTCSRSSGGTEGGLGGSARTDPGRP